CGTDLPGQSAHGRQYHHHRLRGRGDWRPWLDPRLDRHRSRARPARRPLESLLSGGVEHGHLHDDDRRPDDQAGRPLRCGALMALDRTIAGETSARKSRALRANVLWMALGIAALIAAPYFVYPLFLVKFLCMALFAIAFNLLLGGGGLLSFGHAAFFGSGAYIAAEAAKVWGLPFEAAVLVGTATATLLGFLFGAIAIRRQGLYFAMITLALAQGVYFLALRLPF